MIVPFSEAVAIRSPWGEIHRAASGEVCAGMIEIFPLAKSQSCT
jgi:hypothetical protein